MATVLANGPGLSSGTAGEVCKFSILSPSGGAAKFNPAACSVAFEGPSKPEIKFVTSKDGTVECTWTPKLPGNYKIYVRYDDKEITGSPFLCKVTGGEELAKQQVAKIKCSGNALKEGKANLTNEVVVDTKESGIIGGLGVSMEGPAKPEISFKNTEGGILILQYKPSTPGQYKLHLKFQDIHVPGSPFTINVKK
ncbi:Cheerio / Filamin-A/C -like protein [Dinothrombium tinctorium]|uniref:Cheerio / Filamin-A/C-like protein n=1 Tax=Dinothrombium tinctorium TaxID=1965070 RepID=A0A443RRA7_9ACAR|nr:Cheerio / Filamin-A/C -like protein [Dinothrombium tinctorium]